MLRYQYAAMGRGIFSSPRFTSPFCYVAFVALLSAQIVSALPQSQWKAVSGDENSSWCAIPDVALLGVNVTFVQDGKTTMSGGTSAATPMFAAMINRINDERIKSQSLS
ncbi:hypothetical protein FPOAC1_009979 [Fusarium poae]|uniref:hypothetical protein n=1 Tax=Fusarium poae TaxID=36050 RepID=UPI001CEB79F4|nr:hypothetical protein FPOAC1_009979 [Fusarium poae]KAG8670557.1 hypothetical protein FPOAC1_009979 [Fusarium poae]